MIIPPSTLPIKLSARAFWLEEHIEAQSDVIDIMH